MSTADEPPLPPKGPDPPLPHRPAGKSPRLTKAQLLLTTRSPHHLHCRYERYALAWIPRDVYASRYRLPAQVRPAQGLQRTPEMVTLVSEQPDTQVWRMPGTYVEYSTPQHTRETVHCQQMLNRVGDKELEMLEFVVCLN